MIFRRSVVIYYLYSLVTTITTTRFYNNNNHTKRLISTGFLTTTAFKITNPYSRNNYYYNNIQRINIDTNRNQYNKNNIFQQQQFILTIINKNNNNNILLARQSMSTSSTTTTENNNNNNNDDTIQNNVETTTTEVVVNEVMNDNDTDVDNIRNVGRNYCTILNHIHDIAIQCHRNPDSIRLIAVSKTKSINSIMEAYNVGGCRYFGENYVQELITKMNTLSNDPMYNDIQWHFIGTLQSNKCQMLINNINNINQLTIETITSIKLANKLNTVIENKMKTMNNNKEDNDCNNSQNMNNDDNIKKSRLKVFVQINTSGEVSKGGIEPTTNSTACIELCEYIVLHCQYLQLCGLMTIGAPNDTSCFTTLVQCRDDVLLHFKNNQKDNNEAYKNCNNIPTELELSMGMSDDYVDAIRAGSTNVRIGSSIFGHRIYTIK